MSAAANLERRFATDLRSSGRRLEGYAATFAHEANLGAFRERISLGAFRDALSGDVLALLDHDPRLSFAKTIRAWHSRSTFLTLLRAVTCSHWQRAATWAECPSASLCPKAAKAGMETPARSTRSTCARSAS